ncbi:PP2C family protein-serine/threonine phosphatase [Streptomyces sp. NPDC002952]|uniref:PP2C family protein-serine/threonine phosphatase n=1 Tax=Streptomyces sp. NPDC002952 TaxID=3364673 RepID=UPI0036CF43B9
MVNPLEIPPSPRAPADRAEADAAWYAAPCPVLIAAPDGTVREVNRAAAAVLPGAAPGVRIDDVTPGWFTAAHRRLRGLRAEPSPDGPDAAAAHGPVGERSFAAHPVVRGDGAVVWWFVDETAHRLADAQLRTERQRTAFLVEASTRLLSSLNLSRVMDVTARLAAEHLADAALVVAPAAGRRHPVTYCVRGGTPVRAGSAGTPADVPGLEEALQGFPPVPSRWIDPAASPDWVVPPGFGEVGSMVVTPLPGHGAPAGALILLRRSGQASFDESEELFARLLAARAGAALSAARMYAEQASITKTLMRELLPPPLPPVAGIEFAAGYRPSGESERIGGDFYDVHPASGSGEESLVVLGDVCGKGLEAAVLTGKIRNSLHALLPLADDHSRMLTLLNGALLTSRHARFATLVLCSVLRRGRDVRLRLSSAGHPSPLIVRHDGQVEEARTRGTLLGALPAVTVSSATVSLAPGEICLLYTDGITEARGGPLGDDVFGDERLRDALAGCAGMPTEAVVERVQMLASDWVGGGAHDDMAVVAVGAPRVRRFSAVDGQGPGRSAG